MCNQKKLYSELSQLAMSLQRLLYILFTYFSLKLWYICLYIFCKHFLKFSQIHLFFKKLRSVIVFTILKYLFYYFIYFKIFVCVFWFQRQRYQNLLGSTNRRSKNVDYSHNEHNAMPCVRFEMLSFSFREGSFKWSLLSASKSKAIDVFNSK